MAERGAGWPTLVDESEHEGFRLFSDGNVPPSFVRTWYDEGETGLVENPDPDAAVTLIGMGIYDSAEAELLRQWNAMEDDEHQDEARDDLLDTMGIHHAERGATAVILTEQFRFDPRNIDLVDRRSNESLEAARALAARVFMAGGIQPPQQ